MADEAQLEEDLIVECRPAPSSFTAIRNGKPPMLSMATAFPAAIGAALGDQYVTELDGLHNAGAKIMRRSLETAALPQSALGVPVLSKMTAAQKEVLSVLRSPHCL